jgi:hypothetical protein
MNEESKAVKIIEKLACNEESIARLYETYADKFPTLGSFWNSLASEEIKHAFWLKSLEEAAKIDPICIEENRFNVIAIQSYTDYLDKELSRIKTQNIQLIEALSITFYIEDSLIESRFFEVFDSDSQELKNTLMNLIEETTAHRNKVKEELDKVEK